MLRNQFLAGIALTAMFVAACSQPSAPTTATAPAPAVAAFDPEGAVNALESTFGVHAGARRSHAKGVCAVGHFVGDAQARTLSKASLFDGARHDAVLRFSVGGGNPAASDKGRTVRGLGVQIALPGGEVFVSAMLSAPVFFVEKPELFAPFIESRRPDPTTKMPDPERVKAFNAAHPETKPQIDFLAQNNPPASYATTPYWSVHAFRFTNAAGADTYVKWRLDPGAGVQRLTPEEIEAKPTDFLIDELRNRVRTGAVTFTMVGQIAEPGDNVTSAITQWPDTRRTVTLGRLTVTSVSPDARGACTDITFDPNLLPDGVAPSADPLLAARSAPYAISLTRRQAQ